MSRTVDMEPSICPLSRDISTAIRPLSRYVYRDLQRSDLRFLDLAIYQWLRSPDGGLCGRCPPATFTGSYPVTPDGSKLNCTPLADFGELMLSHTT